MLRANRALALLLAVVLALAAVAVYYVYRSRQHQTRAEQAESDATERLWRVSLARAKAERTNPEAGRRAAALEAVKTAAAIRPSVELRNEAISALRTLDLEVETEWPLGPDLRGFQFDPPLEHYASRTSSGVVTLFRIADNAPVRQYPRPALLSPRSSVAEFVFSSTGKYLAVRYEEGPVVLFDSATAQVAGAIGHDGRVTRTTWPPSFTADDALMCLVMSAGKETFVLYDIAAKELRRVADMPEKLKYREPQSQAAVSPRGDVVAWHDGVHVHLMDAVTGADRHEITAPTVVRTLTWDRRGDRLAVGCGNAALFLVEAATGRMMQMGGRFVKPWAQQFNEDGSLLLSAGIDGVTSLWEVDAARLLCQSSEARGMAISASGDRIGWGIPRKKVGVWRVAQPVAGTLLQGSYRDVATIWQQDFSASGRRAVWSPPTWMDANALELCDLAGSHQGVLRLGRKAAAGFLPGTETLWITGTGALTLHDWPDVTQLPQGALPEKGRIPLPPGFQPVMAAFSDNGKYAAVAGAAGQLIAMETANPAAAVSMENGVRFTADVPGPAGAAGSGSLAISPDGRWVIAGRDTRKGDPTIWDARTGRLAARLPIAAAHVAFSPDGKSLVTVGIRQVCLWSTGRWHELWSRDRPASLAGYLGAAAFSPDGSTLAWTSGLDVIELSNAATGVELASFPVSRLYPLTGLRFSGDGSQIFATGPEGKAQIIDTGKLRTEHLAGLGLDWTTAPQAAASGERGTGPAYPGWLPIAFGLAAVGAAGLLGIILFRRQGRLASEFVVAAKLAADKDRELSAERALGELKSRFVTTVSHEFRTPLGIAMSAVELLRHYEDRLPREKRTQLFEDIHSATKNMAGLMEQVLVLGRVDAGKLAYRPAPLDLDALAQKLTDESLSATNRKCPIEWTAENDLSGAHADEALLRHIFTNLISNGVKYSPAGAAVHFHARREGLMAVFTVQDHGIGIPEKDLPELFEAFHRGTNVGEIPGTGLGLVISKRCAELHGGSIQVKSAPGEGTTFTVRIPAW